MECRNPYLPGAGSTWRGPATSARNVDPRARPAAPRPPPPFRAAGPALALLFLANADVAACAAVSAYWADELLLDYAALRVRFGALLPGESAPSFLASLAALAAARGARGCADALATGSAAHHGVAFLPGGCVAWGRNDSGQTGDARLAGGPAGPPLPAYPRRRHRGPRGPPPRGDGAGDDGRCAVYAWGRGDHGRLGVADAFGNCDIRDRATPTVVTLPSEADRRRHARAPSY
ncbi:hypothetical protein JL720_6337 [Aureococcus anophagefferens]|nr:hypothetical protein JL720_6337 [Aureococcus anophagefferens]